MMLMETIVIARKKIIKDKCISNETKFFIGCLLIPTKLHPPCSAHVFG